MQTGKYVEHAVNTNVINDTAELALFNMALAFITENIKVPPTKEIVHEVFSKSAPQDILEYFARDSWWIVQPDPKQVPIYSVVAREILMERILLSEPARK